MLRCTESGLGKLADAPVGQRWQLSPAPNAQFAAAGSDEFVHAPLLGSVYSPEFAHASV